TEQHTGDGPDVDDEEHELLWGGRIQVRGEVGRGAMGQVLLGFDTKLRREMALKVTHLPRGEIPRQLLARFVEEAQVNAQLEHPNIVPVHDLGLDPLGRAYFSMKLVRGRSLEEILEARLNGDEATLSEFGLRRLLDVFLQVCLAMEYAHARGVIHRDLKPANVMIGDFGEVAVMDWGVAKLKEIAAGVSTKAEAFASLHDFSESGPASTPGPVTSVRAETKAWQTHDGAVLGTPHYMSPEQAKGLAVDERSDLYSLGVMLYEILCGQVPFDHEDPAVVVKRVILENPKPPSAHDANVAPALETLAMRLLAKEPEERTLPLRDVRAHIQNYIDGIARDYRGDALWSSVAWSAGALLLFAFLVWYLTGQSIATVLAVGPPAVLNAVGWFLFVLALGYPLWAASTALRVSRRQMDPFREPNAQELFVSGYLAHRTFAATLAPLFQLVFIIELITVAVIQASRGGGRSREIVAQLGQQMRSEWSEALIVVLVFQFAYLVLLASEARFARRIDRCELLVRRAPWESVWPLFLLIVLLASVITTDVLSLAWGSRQATVPLLIWRELLQVPTRPFEIVKTLVFQGTFLLGLSCTTMVAAFPLTELLAASRAVFHAADEASVATRAKYFMRSIAAIRVGRGVWLYGGAMIGTLTAMRVLSEEQGRPLLEKLVYIVGPSLIGFIGYSALRRRLNGFLEQAPAVKRLVLERSESVLVEQRRANLSVLERVPWRLPLGQIAVPLVCLGAYLLWTGSGLQRAVLHQLIPVTTKDWLVVLPYVLLVPMLLCRDFVQRWLLRKADQRSAADLA
ncbi:MAG TPA: serine/threonine-protein kinase, partial [Polyangiaceae bacterium]|nr:serine/threonine-protein kinase [Polyangiaceae bacterium]